MLNSKELQLGKSYRTRNGSIVVLKYCTDHDTYPWEDSSGNCWTVGGEFFLGDYSNLDIISEMQELNEDTVEFNVVTKPKHYQLIPEQNIEVKHIVAILADRLGTNGYNGAFIGDYVQLMQYLMRFDEKNGKEDLEKAKEFLGGMLEKYPGVQQLKGQK